MLVKRRHIQDDVVDALGVSRAVAVVGPRQAGKSTLVDQIARTTLGAQVTTLDNDIARDQALDDPAGFVARLGTPAVIDEVQRAPGVLLAIKRVVDASNAPGQFLITGSADLRLMPTVLDTLPGRVEYFNLWPFSQGEIDGQVETFLDRLQSGLPPQCHSAPVGLGTYAERIVAGGFPGSLGLSPRRREGFFSGYVDALVGRGINDVSGIRHPRAIEPLLRLLAARSGAILKLAGLATDLRLDAKTVAAYIAVLERLCAVVVLPAWSGNLGQRIVKSPRVHIADTALHCHLTGIDAAALTENPQAAGRVLETFVVNELVRQRGWADRPPTLHHLRSEGGNEVDVVAQWPSGQLAGIEVKAGATISRKDFAGLRLMRDRLSDRFTCGVVLHCGEATIPIGDRLWAVPLKGLWS